MKTVVITGASRGIGKATAEKFLDEGWKVVGTSTTGEGWPHENLSWVKLNLAEAESITHAAESIGQQGPFDVLIHNAAMYVEEEDFVDAPITREHLIATLMVNVVGVIDFAEHLLPSLSPDGRIILLGSRSGALMVDRVNSAVPSYRISKAALSMYTRLLAERLRDTRITVSIVDPGWVKTDMGGYEADRDPKEPAQEIYTLAISEVPSGKFWREGKVRDW